MWCNIAKDVPEAISSRTLATNRSCFPYPPTSLPLISLSPVEVYTKKGHQHWHQQSNSTCTMVATAWHAYLFMDRSHLWPPLLNVDPSCLNETSMAQCATLLVCIPKGILLTRERQLVHQRVSWPSEYEWIWVSWMDRTNPGISHTRRLTCRRSSSAISSTVFECCKRFQCHQRTLCSSLTSLLHKKSFAFLSTGITNAQFEPNWVGMRPRTRDTHPWARRKSADDEGEDMSQHPAITHRQIRKLIILVKCNIGRSFD
jgi:hypothetical protein